MKTRDAIFFVLGALVLFVIEHGLRKTPTEGRLKNPFRRYEGPPGFRLSWDGKSPYGKAKRLWPPLHAGGSDYPPAFVWGARYAVQNKLSASETWGPALEQFPTLAQDGKGQQYTDEMLRQAKDRYRVGVNRAMKAIHSGRIPKE